MLDAGTAVANLTRLGAPLYDAQGALHCQSFPQETGVINIQCWDGKGRFLSKSDQRKLENIFLRDDYPRTADDELGDLSFVTGLSEHYLMLCRRCTRGRKGFGCSAKAHPWCICVL